MIPPVRILLAALVVLGFAAPVAAHHAPLDNRVVNGGFEMDLLGWLQPNGCCPTVSVTDGLAGPTPCEGAKSLVVRNAPGGAIAYQSVATVGAATASASPDPLLDVQAAVLANAGNPGAQSVRVVDGVRAGSGAVLAHVSFAAGHVSFGAYGSPDGNASLPAAPGCHRYQLHLTPGDEGEVVVSLHVDGVPVASVVGDAAHASEVEGIVQLGDLSFDARTGAAPDVMYDGVFFAGHQAF